MKRLYTLLAAGMMILTLSRIAYAEKVPVYAVLPVEVKHCTPELASGLHAVFIDEISRFAAGKVMYTAAVDMPVLIGSHTAMNALFVKCSRDDDPVFIALVLEKSDDAAHFRFSVRILPCENGASDYTAHSGWYAKNEIGKGISETARALAKHVDARAPAVSGSMPVTNGTRATGSIDARRCYLFASFIRPAGEFAKIVRYASSAGLEIRHGGLMPVHRNIDSFVRVSVSRYRPGIDPLSALVRADLCAGAAYRFSFRNYSYSPGLSAGGSFSSMRRRGEGGSRSYFHPVSAVHQSAEYTAGALGLFADCSVSAFPDSGTIFSYVSISLGGSFLWQ